jgi:hypothetical protein
MRQQKFSPLASRAIALLLILVFAGFDIPGVEILSEGPWHNGRGGEIIRYSICGWFRDSSKKAQDPFEKKLEELKKHVAEQVAGRQYLDEQHVNKAFRKYKSDSEEKAWCYDFPMK